MAISNQQIVASLWWKILERLFTQGVNLIVQIILARILMPEDFGVLAIIIAITNYAGLFVQSGLSTALVQKKELEPLDVGTLLISSLSIAAIMYLGLFFAAPYLAQGYKLPDLLWPLRIVALTLFLNAINSVQSALYFRAMRFKALFFRSFFAVLISGMIGIFMAYEGYGIWALVMHTLTNVLIIIIYMAFDSNARLNWLFSFDRAKVLYAFSGKILLANLISGFGDTLRTMLIGKKYATDQLAYYDKAYTYSNYVTQSITLSLSTVLLPVFSQQQDDIEHLRAMARKSVQMTAFLVIPILIAVIATSKPLVILLLTNKWAPCIPFLMLFCLLRIPGCITSIDKQVFYAIGNSSISMYYEVFILISNVIMLIITIPIGIMAIAIGATIIEFIGCFIIFIVSKKVYKYKLKERFSDLYRPTLYSISMAIAMYSVFYLGLSDLTTLIIQIITGIVVYFGLAKLCKDKNLSYIQLIIKNKLTQ